MASQSSVGEDLSKRERPPRFLIKESADGEDLSLALSSGPSAREEP